MENSKINWTDHTWNPWIGCRHVSAECDHCYADALVTNRMGRDFSVVQRTKTWKDPLRWNRKAPQLAAELGRRVRVFCASLTDFFIQDADQWRDEAWEVIRRCNEMDWLILTKRPQLIPRRLPADWDKGWPHVWLGTTCGVRNSYPRLDALREIPSAVRFISAEPLLESLADINLDGFHWLIAGGESGPGSRVTGRFATGTMSAMQVLAGCKFTSSSGIRAKSWASSRQVHRSMPSQHGMSFSNSRRTKSARRRPLFTS